MKKQEETKQQDWNQEFEKIFILTCHDVYSHAERLMDYDYGIAKELLIETYVDAHQRKVSLPSIEKQTVWLKKVADSIAESRSGLTKEEVEIAYTEGKRKAKENVEKAVPNIDEASIYLEIMDRISQLDIPEGTASPKAYVVTTVQGIFSLVLLGIAVVALAAGVVKVKEQLEVLKEPFVKKMSVGEEDRAGVSFQREEDKRVKINGKVVYLSDIGQVLYSLPLEETDMAGESPLNPEIQKQTGWTYYLPCPDRSDTQLAEVAPSLYHTLYRMRGDGEMLEIVAREVEDYIIFEGGIYVAQFGRIQRIDTNDEFETQVPGIYARVEHDEIYLHDTLGRTLKSDSDGSIHYGDRIFTMYSNRIEDVNPAPRVKDHISYYLKETENGGSNDIYRNVNGQEELFEAQGQTIDSFCIAGDWIYYSAYIRRGGSGAHYSEIYRRSLTGEGEKAEKLHEEFTGRIRQMSYSEEEHQIYANYIPKNWKSNHGVIAVITMSGQMSYLDDEVLRAEEETTGNDMLEFIMVKDGLVYCYWKDCVWEPGETPIAIWRKVLMIPDDNRVWMDD